jgi:hypothetical protein
MAEFQWKMSPAPAGVGGDEARLQSRHREIEARWGRRGGCRRFWKVLIMFGGDSRGEEARGWRDGFSSK